MRLSIATTLLRSVAAVVLLIVFAGCDDGSTDKPAGRETVDRSAQLDAAQAKADAAAADLVPALVAQLGVTTRVWRGDFRTCSAPSTQTVAYHLTIQLDPVPGGAERGLPQVGAVLDDLGWDTDTPGRTTLNANLESTGLSVLLGAGATDLRMATDCVDVGREAGAEYADRDVVDFIGAGD